MEHYQKMAAIDGGRDKKIDVIYCQDEGRWIGSTLGGEGQNKVKTGDWYKQFKGPFKIKTTTNERYWAMKYGHLTFEEL